MKRLIVTGGCIAAILFSPSIVVAQGRGNGGPKVKPTTGAAAKGGGSAAHGGGKPAGSARPTGTGQGKAHGPTAKANPGGKHTPTTKTTGPKTKPTTPATEGTTATKSPKKSPSAVATTDALSPVQQKLKRNTNLAGKLEDRLPPNMTLMDAAEGFDSLGKFVSTVNAAHNHELDFAKLKIAILDDGMSLGQAMKEQRSALDVTLAATRAERDADALIKSTESPVIAPTKVDTKPRSPKDSRQ